MTKDQLISLILCSSDQAVIDTIEQCYIGDNQINQEKFSALENAYAELSPNERLAFFKCMLKTKSDHVFYIAFALLKNRKFFPSKSQSFNNAIFQQIQTLLPKFTWRVYRYVEEDWGALQALLSTSTQFNHLLMHLCSNMSALIVKSHAYMDENPYMKKFLTVIANALMQGIPEKLFESWFVFSATLLVRTDGTPKRSGKFSADFLDAYTKTVPAGISLIHNDPIKFFRSHPELISFAPSILSDLELFFLLFTGKDGAVAWTDMALHLLQTNPSDDVMVRIDKQVKMFSLSKRENLVATISSSPDLNCKKIE